jgi:transcription antitermination factor NusG
MLLNVEADNETSMIASEPPTRVMTAQVSRRWYALYTRHQFEKSVHGDLLQMGLEPYLPMRSTLRQWSDRRKWIATPLFSCYVFIHANPKERLMSLTVNGVVRMVSSGGQPSRIPDEEIETVRRIVDAKCDPEPAPNLVPGDLLEIIAGPLRGVRGRLRHMHGENRLIIAFETIGQSLAIKVDRDRVRKIAEKNHLRRVSA